MSTWTATAQARNAPLSTFWAVGQDTSFVIWRLARHLEAITHQHGCWPGRGYDPKSYEHGTARALDWMISSKVGIDAEYEGRVWVGDLIVAWLIRHADQLHIRHIIWNRRIWKRRYRGTATEWTRLVNRSGVSDWHQDHIHVFCDDAYGTVPDAPLGTGTIGTGPGLPSTGVSWDGKTYPGESVFTTGRQHDAVEHVQQRLVIHGYDPGPVDGYWGDRTQTATAAFQVAQGWTGTDANGIPGPTTWQRLNLTPTPKDWFDMADKAELKDALNEVLWEHVVPGHDGIPGSSWRNNMLHVTYATQATLALVRELAQRQGIDVDEAALARELAATISPVLRGLISDEVGEQVADRVVAKLGAALTPKEN